MKRLRIVFLLPILVILSGCTQVRERVEQLMWEHSGVTEDVAYNQYQQMQASDALDKDGLYHSAEVESYEKSLEKPGTVHVTFARNDFLDFKYYRDESYSEPLETTDCWLNPGDAVFAGEPELINPISRLYRFSEFVILELGEKGSIKEVLQNTKNIPGEIYRIPDDFTGTDISVIPIGEYQNRTVKLSAVTVAPDGSRKVLENGSWEIDGKRYGNVRVQLNPVESYRIIYDYTPYLENQYFAGSSPEFYWENNRDGTITFLADPSDNEYMEYEVRFHPYGLMTITNAVTYQNMVDSLLDGAAAIFGNSSVIETQNLISLIQVNGLTKGNNFSDTEVTVPELKVGDEILIRVPADMKLVSEDIKELSAAESDAGRDYRFLIPDTDTMHFHLSVTKRNLERTGVFHETVLEHAKFEVFNSSGIRYREGSELPAENERVTVMITPEKDFCVYGKNVKGNVYQADMKYSDLADHMEEILESHPVKPGISVTLDTEDELGECAFWTGTERLSGTVMLREGQDLQFDYLLDPESGYEIYLTPEERMMGVEVWSPYASSRSLDVTEELQGETLRCRDFVTIQEGVKSDAAHSY